MSGAAEEELRGLVRSRRGRAVAARVARRGTDARDARRLFGGVVAVRLRRRERLLLARLGGARLFPLRLRAVLLGGALECFVDSAHHESPWPSQRRKARLRSSTPGVALPDDSPPPSSSRSTSCSCRTCSARPTPVCAALLPASCSA